jgi:hypothetical protein
MLITDSSCYTSRAVRRMHYLRRKMRAEKPQPRVHGLQELLLLLAALSEEALEGPQGAVQEFSWVDHRIGATEEYIDTEPDNSAQLGVHHLF